MVSGGCDSSATESMNGGDGEEDTEGARDDVATEIGEGMVEVLNISGEAADDCTLAAGGKEAGVMLIVWSGFGGGAAATEDVAISGGDVAATE